MNTASPRPDRLAQGRQAASDRRRSRLTAAVEQAAAGQIECTVAAITRAAGVHRSFAYRHPDLLQLIHHTAAGPPAFPTTPRNAFLSRPYALTWPTPATEPAARKPESADSKPGSRADSASRSGPPQAWAPNKPSPTPNKPASNSNTDYATSPSNSTNATKSSTPPARRTASS